MRVKCAIENYSLNKKNGLLLMKRYKFAGRFFTSKYLYIFIFQIVFFNSYAQTISSKHDSLLLVYSETPKTLNNLSKLISLTYEMSDFSTDTAYILASQIQAIQIPAANKQLICENILNLGLISKMKGKYSESNKLLFKALNIANSTKLLKLQIICNYEIGDLYRCLGLYDKSLLYLYTAKKIAQQYAQTDSFPRLFDCLSSTFYELSYTATRKYALRKIPYQNEFDWDNFEKNDWLKLCKNYVDSANLVLKITRDYRTEINCMNLLGVIYQKQKKYDTAIRLLNNAIQIAQEHEFYRDIPNYYNNLSLIYRDMNNKEASLDIGIKAYNLATKTNILSHLFVTANNLAYSYKDMKDYENALIFTEISGHKHFDIISYENFIRLSELDAQYQADQRQKEIEHQNQAIKIEKSRIKIRNLIIILLLMTVLVIISGIIYIFNRNKQLRNAHNKISEQNQELNKINNTKDKLISIIAHDLRGPVGSINSVLTLVCDNMDDPKRFEKLLKLASQQAENTYIMLENLLYWVRNQLQNPVANMVLQEIAPVISDLKNVLLHIANEKNIKLKINIDKTLNALFDKEMITIVIRNLITNAIKFTPEGGTVTVKTYKLNDKLIVEIVDTGIGIPKEKLNEIIDSTHFYTTYGTNNEKGTGIGLSLCKEFVEKHGEKIWVESEVGKGSEFKFTLPMKNERVID